MLADHATGGPIADVRVLDEQVLRGVRLRDSLRGRRFASPRRHGKWLVAPVRGEGQALAPHFGMTGALVWSSGGEQRHRHDRVVFGFDSGELRYRDMRKLKGLHLARDEAELGHLLDGARPGRPWRSAFPSCATCSAACAGSSSPR